MNLKKYVSLLKRTALAFLPSLKERWKEPGRVEFGILRGVSLSFLLSLFFLRKYEEKLQTTPFEAEGESLKPFSDLLEFAGKTLDDPAKKKGFDIWDKVESAFRQVKLKGDPPLDLRDRFFRVFEISKYRDLFKADNGSLGDILKLVSGSAVGPGEVYESLYLYDLNFLDTLILEKKAEKSKKWGRIYTPDYVVSHIAKKTLGGQLGLILDPSAGTGRFCLEALELLTQRVDENLRGDQRIKLIEGLKESSLTELPELDKNRETALLKRFIANNCIFGIDRDAAAIEITKLSLIIASLIPGMPLIDPGKHVLARDFLLDPIPFEDVAEYSLPKFDAIIGNPPYVRIQNLHPEERRELKKRYKSCRGSFDIYTAFVERGAELLKKDGRLGFILPNSFLNLDYGRSLKGLLADRGLIKEIVNFGHNQIFPGRTTYTALLFLENSKNKTFVQREVKYLEEPSKDIVEILELDFEHPGTSSIEIPSDSMELQNLRAGVSSTAYNSGKFDFVKMENSSVPLGEYADRIFTGVQTSADGIFILKPISWTPEGGREKRIRLYSRVLEREVLLEKKVLRPIVSGRNVDRFGLSGTAGYVIFPYRVVDDKVFPIDRIEMKKKYPHTLAYLEENRKALEKRMNTRIKDALWYEFGRRQNIGLQDQVKIGAAQTVKRLEMFLDFEGEYCFHNVRVNGITLKNADEESYLVLLGLLNSSLINFYFKYRINPARHRGGYYAANRQFLSPIPIHENIDTFRDRNDFVEKVSLLIDLKKHLHKLEKQRSSRIFDKGSAKKYADRRKMVEMQIKETDLYIDKIVYELYGITSREIEEVHRTV